MGKKEALRKLMRRKQSVSFYAQKLGISSEEVIKLRKEIRQEIRQDKRKQDLPISGRKDTYEEGKHVIEASWTFPPTPEEVIKKYKIDTNLWKISQMWAKEQGSVYRVSVNLQAINKKESNLFDFSKFLQYWKPKNKPFSKIKSQVVSNKEHSVFVDLTDFHLDKKGLFGETIEERVRMFMEILTNLMDKSSKSHGLEEVVFIIGSDMLHTDTFFNTTTNGTPQDVIVDGLNAYSLAFELYTDAIELLRSYSDNIKVVLVRGNHGRDREFFLAHALSTYFKDVEDVTFDINPSPRKVHTYGNTFIGLHHGNCKIDELPLVFAKEFASLWGQCKYHEVIVGDKHFYYEKEIKGVRVKQLPALADTDRWHNDNNYVENIRAAVCTIYHRVAGRVAEFEERYVSKN